LGFVSRKNSLGIGVGPWLFLLGLGRFGIHNADGIFEVEPTQKSGLAG